MKINIIFIWLTFLLSLLYACGGVIGHIAMIDYHGISKIELEGAIDRTFDEHPELRIDSNLGDRKYKNSIRHKRYYCQVSENGVFYVLWIHIFGEPSESDSTVVNNSSLALIGGTILGDSIHTQRSLTEKDEKNYTRMFKTYYLKVLHQDTVFSYRISPHDLKLLEE